MKVPPRLSCVIFDIDGTLTSTNTLIFATFNHVAGRHLGRSFTPAEIIGLFGPPEEGAVEKIFGSERVPAIMDELCDFYRAHHREMARLHEGMDEALHILRAHGVRLAVFTGKGRRTTAITLEVLGIQQYFDMIITGNDVLHHKPAPEGIERIVQGLEVPAEETVMVGDSMADVRASRGAGVTMAAVLWDAYDRQRVLEAGADLVFETVPEFVAWCRSHGDGAAFSVPPPSSPFIS